MERLDGGRSNIYSDGKKVSRPLNEWSVHVHDFLLYLYKHGFTQVPYPLGIADGHEMVSYIEGDVYNGDLSDDAKSDETLIAFAKFIRKYHDIGSEYVKSLKGDESWMLSIKSQVQTMCHGDLAPYNTVLDRKNIIGLIDFDTLHPGSRLWDISYALYRWVPLMDESNPENFGSRLDKQRRLELFLEAYGSDVLDEDDIFKTVISRLEYLISFMIKKAEEGDETFVNHEEQGHLKTYKDDIHYIKLNWL